jgi:type I restriction enzyme, S subunit
MIETKFKETEVGKVPADWEVKTLGEISQDTAYGVAAEATTYDSKNRYIRITDISDENGTFQPNPLTSPSFFTDEHIVKENDLLVARTGATVGKTYIYNHSDGKLVYAGFLIKTNICKADSKYVFYFTQTYPYKLWVISESMRSGQPGINAEQLKTLNIPLPPLPEQRRIATALSDIDSLISSLDELIEKKRNIKQGTMQQLLTGKTRLNGFSEPWVEKKLGDVEIRNGSMLKSSEYKDGVIPVIAGGKTPAGFHSEYNREKDTITISGSGANAGYIAFYHNPIFASDCSTINEQEDFDIKFMYYTLLLKQEAVYKCQAGGAQPHIHAKDISDIVLLLPTDMTEQHAIASILTSMDDEISALEQKREKYVALKQGMMQELLTGRIRLV